VEGMVNCYKKLVKESLVNILRNCDNNLSKEFIKVSVHGRCVEFSPEVINIFLGRNEEACAEVEVTDDQSQRKLGSYPLVS